MFFVLSNYQNLAMETAKGSGEYTKTLAILLKISEKKLLQYSRKIALTSDPVKYLEVVMKIKKSH
ncbi:MAG: hypothetical protein ACTSXL_05560 [Alphaproteobacteria bacterium]|nr:MAG: hypothetical protein B6I23_02505 [Rickettsiaceae bacterium 4572_127]